MKLAILRIVFLLGIFILVFTLGCKKAFDYLSDHKLVGFCQIKKITFTGIFPTPDTAVFTYNSQGDPVSIIRRWTGTGYTNFLFRYDGLHRLTDQINVYGVDVSELNPPESWNKYFYDDKGRIALDSQYFFPNLVNGKPVPGQLGAVSIFKYEYDPFDRLISVTWEQLDKVNSITNYSYDANGNLTGRVYDDKINFHRCNKIWMFLARDYSVNNPLNAFYTYNRTGLPVNIDCTKGNSENFMDEMMGFFGFNQADIEYGCP
ncbi:MAG TPA: RHS repeat domain-containing protein [Puia sp.]|nr:RHS repeat domain-containing protein [Puia sp.]